MKDPHQQTRHKSKFFLFHTEKAYLTSRALRATALEFREDFQQLRGRGGGNTSVCSLCTLYF